MSDNVIQAHLEAASQVADSALASYLHQFGAEDYATVSDALRAGGMIKIETTLSLAGLRHVEVFLVVPSGERFQLGRVAFEGEQELQ